MRATNVAGAAARATASAGRPSRNAAAAMTVSLARSRVCGCSASVKMCSAVRTGLRSDPDAGSTGNMCPRPGAAPLSAAPG